jgi:hypothetical protein
MDNAQAIDWVESVWALQRAARLRRGLEMERFLNRQLGRREPASTLAQDVAEPLMNEIDVQTAYACSEPQLHWMADQLLVRVGLAKVGESEYAHLSAAELWR